MTAAPLLPEVRIDEHAPAEVAREFLERDRLLAAYALADLDPENEERPRWHVARREDEVVAIALIAEALPYRPCFATGEVEALALLFREALREPRIVVATPPSGRIAVEAGYRYERCDRMRRMAADVARFRPRVTHRVARLDAEHLEDMIGLYGHASRTYFTPRRIRREIYCGVYAGDTLVSAAGTHVKSRASGIAVVGNVLTRVGYRGRGMATSCTSAVTEAALEQHRDVVLNVREDNVPAIAVYERLGFDLYAPFVEGPAVRRASWDRLTKQIFGRET